jgi:7-keto-8-aminopelargonate synthetase-like enzyme
MATFSKALAGFGAFVAGSPMLREILLNKARSFVFTTAPPAATAAAALAAAQLVAGSEGDARRRVLVNNIRQLRDGLASMHLLQPGAGETPIFPVLIGAEDATMATSRRLLELGFYAQGIRPPTVPPGTSRLRISLMATHTSAQIAGLLTAVRDLQRNGLIPAAAA